MVFKTVISSKRSELYNPHVSDSISTQIPLEIVRLYVACVGKINTCMQVYVFHWSTSNGTTDDTDMHVSSTWQLLLQIWLFTSQNEDAVDDTMPNVVKRWSEATFQAFYQPAYMST